MRDQRLDDDPTMKGTMMNPTMKGQRPADDPTMNPDARSACPWCLGTGRGPNIGTALSSCLPCRGTGTRPDPDDPGVAVAPSSPPGISHEIPPAPLAHLIPVGAISPSPLNPRRRFDEGSLAELAESIREHGLLEPLVVRRQAGLDKPFSLLAGERRWRASMLAGLAEVLCVIREATDDAEALSLMLVENLQREDLDPISQASAFARLGELGWTQSAIGAAVGKSQPVIANAIRLLALPQEVRDLVADGTLSQAHGRALARWNTDPDRCRRMAAQTLEHDLTSRDLERMRDDLEELRERHGLEAAAAQERDDAAPAEISTGADVEVDVRVCRVCGCTDLTGCEEGCWWVDTDLCSSCTPRETGDAYGPQRHTGEAGAAGGETTDTGRRAEWQAHLDELRARAYRRVRNHAHFDRFDILVTWRRLHNLRNGCVREAALALGLPNPGETFGETSSAPTSTAASYLKGLGPILRAQLVALATVYSELAPVHDWPGSPTPLTDWLLGGENE